ncbi:MAG: response regulator [Methylobacteriaceae bacterium]|nr:response regulator [Methylobacteriaceae bacterium]
MFILPITPSPGEHGEEDHTAGMIPRARRFLRLDLHMGVDGFIVSALVIQTLSIAGIMPAQVWNAQLGYALTVCMGLLILSACILFSLKSLLTQPSQVQRRAARPVQTDAPSAAPSEVGQTTSVTQPDSPVALVLQSSRTVQAIIEKSLARTAIRSVCALDEAAAWRSLEANTIDLFIADAALYESDRCKLLREMCHNKEIPVLTLTSKQPVRPQQAHPNTSVSMPIVPDDLARAAFELIGRPARRTDGLHSEAGTAPRREMPKLEPEPLDARALGDLEKLGGRDFVRDIVAQFVADAAAVLASLTVAITKRDQQAFREQAHALRSCAANVGAQNVYRMCLAWRDLDAQEIAASGAQYMQMLEAEFERVRGALLPMLQQGDGPAPDSEAA